MEREQRYLEKLQNDVDERMYDLLVMHLIDFDKKISFHKKEFVSLLEIAIQNLRKNVNNFNRLSYFRYILILCNSVLRFENQRQDIKDIKKEIIEEFTHSENDDGEKIPLNYQINEIRLTFDANYLIYLTNQLIQKKKWAEALYCFITIKLIEPDNENIDYFDKVIHENISVSNISERIFEFDGGQVVLDSNVVISQILHDVGDYKIYSENVFDLEKLGNIFKFIITPSVKEEVRSHLDFVLVKAKKFCIKNSRFNYEEIKNTLEKRFEKIISKYFVDVKSQDHIDVICEFYQKYLDVLEKILLEKISSSTISKKLRKLAQRESLLPEKGDMQLLSEAIDLGVGIFSADKDFTKFVSPIYEKFGVKVYEGGNK